ncbi:hypothetical protein AVEN_180095-1 [Araneus ventricosus]|uniref:Uncharacterized protein n=1 Tax=Araneus ventricosus TaxID=182803 RepID=A0A4Y2Q1T6_ARAVE|nr:hypothetical protein AVEN_158279-1 [Araneus ventricosus]GBN57378.1 hypothetical protein AVEN_180095-1 [Araneus ventricosus]
MLNIKQWCIYNPAVHFLPSEEEKNANNIKKNRNLCFATVLFYLLYEPKKREKPLYKSIVPASPFFLKMCTNYFYGLMYTRRYTNCESF